MPWRSITFIAFEGYEIIVQSGEEVKKPGTTIPRAIFFSILIAVLIYLLVATVMLGAVRTPDDHPVYIYLGQLKELGLMEAAGQFVPHGKVILLIAGLASTNIMFIMVCDGNPSAPPLAGPRTPLRDSVFTLAALRWHFLGSGSVALAVAGESGRMGHSRQLDDSGWCDVLFSAAYQQVN
jgi:amino acid transporter